MKRLGLGFRISKMMPLDNSGKSISVAQIETEVHRFLGDKEPEVLCISGRWGVGKTFAWNYFLRRVKDAVALRRYSYVSLFGVNSIEELKYAIFENSIPSSSIGVEPSLDSLMSNTSALAERFGKKSLWFFQQLPKVKGYVGGLGPLWFLSVKEMIVCIDDIERHGKDLRVRDILGLVSVLKEQKKCKVVLILNDEALERESDKEDFKTFLEKVVDAFLKFVPSSEECVKIALPDPHGIGKMLADDFVILGISNIRVMRRIERAARHLGRMLGRFNEQVVRGVVHSVALLGWSVYEPNRAPSLEYLRNRLTKVYGPKPKEPQSEEETAWDRLLEAYNFFGMDEFDEVLLDGLRNGFFDETAINGHASALNERVTKEKISEVIRASWVPFHDSFANNTEEVRDAIYKAAIGNVEYLSLLDLNNVAVVLKGLGNSDKAKEVIAAYVASRRVNPQALNLDAFPFRNRIDDPDVIDALKANFVEAKKLRDPIEIILGFAQKTGWLNSEIDQLASLPADEYYRIFKLLNGDALRTAISACLEFDRVANATPGMREISARARQALLHIGKESPLNSLRVEAYGIRLDHSSPEDHAVD